MSQALTLKIHKNGQPVEQKLLSQDVIKIGKLRSSHICLEDDSVARMHAVIEVSGSDIRVIDLGSSSGTILNGRRVEKSDVLKSGDVLEFGPYRIEVEVGEAAGAAAAPASYAAAHTVGHHAASPAAAAPAAAVAAAPGVAARPVMMIDASEVEVQDGNKVTEVITSYGGTVLDVQHVGQVKNKRSQAPALLVLGGALFLGGAALFATDVAQDWESYDKAVKEANDRGGMQRPEVPGLNLGGVGIGLALLGLVPFALGVIRLGDQGLDAYTLGEGLNASFPAPTQGLPDNVAFPLVRGGTREPTLQFTRDMEGEVSLDGQRLTLAELVNSGRAGAAGAAFTYPIPQGAHCRVQHGDLVFYVNSVAPGRVFATKSETDKPFWLYNAGSLAIIGSLLVLVNLRPEDELSMDLEESMADNRFLGYLSQPDQIEEEPPPEEQEDSDDEAGGQGQRHKGEEGKMGKPTSQNKAGLYAMKGPKDAIPSMARNFDPEMQARQAGILGMMAADNGHFLASPFGTFAQGNDDADVWGGLTGTEIGEANGVGGLGLVGTGRGGGGSGEGTIGLGQVGTIGKGGGGGSGSGYGRGSGAGFGGRGARVPRVRQASANVKGRMDKDIIRRIIRSHINEVSHCYNQGLARDYNLKGRVAIQFTIGPTGVVMASAVAESSLKDASVAQCIAKAVRRWKFPKPDGGGNVMVTYPFVLEATG